MDSKTQKQVRDRLEKIRSRNQGVLTPDDVVKDASSKTSPLHAYFTWDDSEAAHRYRLDEARSLIRNVKVEVTTTSSRIAAPFYVRDPRVGPENQGYGSIAEIRDERDVAADSLRYEFDRAIGLLKRAVDIAEALGIADQVQDLLNQAQVIHRSIPQKIKKTSVV